MTLALSIALFLPLLGFLIILITSKKISRRAAGWIACTTILTSFILFSGLLYTYVTHSWDPQTISLYQWIAFKGINASFNLTLDPLSLLMTMIITGVGFLIHVYSIGYMDEEEDYARFFACLNFFVFAMLLLVLASNLLLLFVGWEGVGLASYLLIGFWYTKPEAAKAATKAFIVNRIGDLGLLVGLLLTFQTFGTSDITEISQKVAQQFALGATLLSVLTFLYFWGATGKSAQLPLYTWLPDAMEGPTPVSALIHAATMVTAGVYLVVRMHDLFMLTPETLHLVGDVGGITALFAALCALGQTDLKRVLAYSTISQLGFMFLACGVGAFYAAMFHLTTHAFVKALLFLSAGNVVHMMHGTTEMAKMGGLAKKFTKTHWLFLIGALALSGIPPLSAFFSKELILEQEHLAGFEKLFYVGIATSILTSFYLIRAYCLTFLGTTSVSKEMWDKIKEAPKIMLIPVTILAMLSILGGLLGFTYSKLPILESFLEQVGVGLPVGHGSFAFTPETIFAMASSLLGVISAYIIYTRYRDSLGNTFKLLTRSFYVNEFYQKTFVNPLKALSSLIVHQVEPKIFDKSILATGNMVQGTAQWMQGFQSGQIRSYLAWIAAGAALIIIYLIL